MYKQINGTDMKENSHDLIKVLFHHLPGKGSGCDLNKGPPAESYGHT
jgi:hypothetical protein